MGFVPFKNQISNFKNVITHLLGVKPFLDRFFMIDKGMFRFVPSVL